jgi:general stress protein 26
MDKENALQKGLELIKSSKIAMIGTLDDDGYPNIKAMLNLVSDGMKTIWFSTNTSSKRVTQIKKNMKASVYFVDQDRFKGLLLVGEMEVANDEESRKKLWFEGSERYYPLGISDPDYCVLRFTARKGNYYQGLQNISFDIE